MRPPPTKLIVLYMNPMCWLGEVQHDPRHLTTLRDEAPAAYRDLRVVLRAQRDLVRQRARLTPLLNFKYPDSRQRSGVPSMS